MGFESEPLTVGWALLSRMPLYHPLFNTLSAEQRRMWANAALIVPLSSRFAWENALVKYAKDIPLHLRLYAVQPLRLDDQMIALCRQEPCLDPTREAHYESILYEKLPYIRRKRRRTKIGKPYKVYVMRPGNTMRWLPYDRAAHQLGVLFSDERARLARRDAASALRLGHEATLNFVHEVLTKRLERPTLAVIEAEGWRNGHGQHEQQHCWTQLRNPDLFRYRNVLRFDMHRTYDRAAPALDRLLGVVRLRMNNETPQYITASDWAAEELMRDLLHLTGYVDPCVPNPLHYLSIAGLPKTQKDQNLARIRESFKADIKDTQYDDIAFKHPQIIEMVPFFIHPDFQSDEGQRQLCRCVHFLRISPAFTSGDIMLPYPMHLGEKLIEDQLVILGADSWWPDRILRCVKTFEITSD